MKGMKKFYLILLGLLLCVPISSVSAKAQQEASEVEEEVVAETVKYYKTYSNLLSDTADTYTVEVNENEYNIGDQISTYDNSIETTYKKMVTSISKNGSYYRYKVVLTWKNMPSTRSYDIIGIGYPASVYQTGIITFQQYSCTTSGNCTTTTTNMKDRFVNGVGAVFALPTGSLSTLTETLYFDVTKNTTSTIYRQAAYGDYAHATKTITSGLAQMYEVDCSGIILESSNYNYYDEIGTALATWSGTW